MVFMVILIIVDRVLLLDFLWLIILVSLWIVDFNFGFSLLDFIEVFLDD